MVDIIFDEKAIEYIEKLPSHSGQRILKKILEAKANPHHFFSKLTHRDEYKLRIGKYRVIADINQEKIFILKIGLRKNVYK